MKPPKSSGETSCARALKNHAGQAQANANL